MNELIRELAEQAGMKEVPSPTGFDSFMLVLNKEKFAELIVRECMSLVSAPGPDMNDTERGILAQIKEHFGVLE